MSPVSICFPADVSHQAPKVMARNAARISNPQPTPQPSNTLSQVGNRLFPAGGGDGETGGVSAACASSDIETPRNVARVPVE